MEIEACSVRYIYAELMEITARREDSLCPSVGNTTIALRMEYDESEPTAVIALSPLDAVKLHADLERIFREYEQSTGYPMPTTEDVS